MTQHLLSVRQRYARLLSVMKWVGTVAGIGGALIIAMNIGVVAHGFMLFLVSSVLWGLVAWAQREVSLLVMQGAATVINMLGIIKWLGV